MEQLWSRAGATAGNRQQSAQPNNPPEHAKSAAIGCRRLPSSQHGKECHEEGPPAESCSARPRETKGGPTQCCTPVWISAASVSTSTCSLQRARWSSAVL